MKDEKIKFVNTIKEEIKNGIKKKGIGSLSQILEEARKNYLG